MAESGPFSLAFSTIREKNGGISKTKKIKNKMGKNCKMGFGGDPNEIMAQIKKTTDAMYKASPKYAQDAYRKVKTASNKAYQSIKKTTDKIYKASPEVAKNVYRKLVNSPKKRRGGCKK